MKGSYYHIVLENITETEKFQGVRIRKTFETKNEFNEWYTPKIQKNIKLIAQGISDEEAMKICLNIT